MATDTSAGPFGTTIPSTANPSHDSSSPSLPFRLGQSSAEPFVRRQGEPDWNARPVARLNGDIEPSPVYNEYSWEELELQTRMKQDPIAEEDDDIRARLTNSLSRLQDSGDMVDVVVGKEGARWHLHEKLICAASPFFNAAVNSLFREGVEKKIVMEEDDAAVFILFVQWLYTDQFNSKSMWLLLKAYVFADKLGAVAFQTQALGKLYTLNTFQCKFTVQQILWALDNTTPESALRKLTIDTVGFGICSKSLALSAEDWESLNPVMPEIMQGVVAVVAHQKDQRWTPKPLWSYQL